jgi:hypothetical protein
MKKVRVIPIHVRPAVMPGRREGQLHREEPPVRAMVRVSGGATAAFGAFLKTRWNWSSSTRNVGATVDPAVTG